MSSISSKYLRILSIFSLHFVKNKDFRYFFLLWAMHWLFPFIRNIYKKKIIVVIIIENIKKSLETIVILSPFVLRYNYYYNINRIISWSMSIHRNGLDRRRIHARKLHFSLISSPVLFRNRWWFDLTHRHVLSDDFCWLQYCSKLFINSIVLP